ncbi:hypothetical protein PISMIDRAFT_675290 [Pisolithus microcarpus 441]|uniref:Uncharacterized protein n=1 Tax=Pisolithus microcarpus 441 TaxID=765257 RepID=A0A0C9ZM96_9AGAM|nr:hypothetical protein BKA83DRAFT_675290 [Pisolithus microcarpus]KIK26984.1 hypothetical protein PISMIDRAFT_675290 [Pisolithus microcarpus 441]
MLSAGAILHKGFGNDSNTLIVRAALGLDQHPVLVQTGDSREKVRKTSKDMVSHPAGFVHLVHASDADQAEALLTRWGPDGNGKLRVYIESQRHMIQTSLTPDPRWANLIKARVRQTNQVVNALKPSVGSAAGDQRSPL